MKVVINKCFGGFGLSPEATLKLYERGAPIKATPVDEYWPIKERQNERKEFKILGYEHSIKEWREYLAGVDKGRGLFLHVFSPDEKFVLSAREIPRHDPQLVKIVEEMGEKSSGACADLGIVEIPDGIDYTIEEYDGNEHIAESHRTWGYP